MKTKVHVSMATHIQLRLDALSVDHHIIVVFYNYDVVVVTIWAIWRHVQFFNQRYNVEQLYNVKFFFILTEFSFGIRRGEIWGQ